MKFLQLLSIVISSLAACTIAQNLQDSDFSRRKHRLIGRSTSNLESGTSIARPRSPLPADARPQIDRFAIDWEPFVQRRHPEYELFLQNGGPLEADRQDLHRVDVVCDPKTRTLSLKFVPQGQEIFTEDAIRYLNERDIMFVRPGADPWRTQRFVYIEDGAGLSHEQILAENDYGQSIIDQLTSYLQSRPISDVLSVIERQALDSILYGLVPMSLNKVTYMMEEVRRAITQLEEQGTALRSRNVIEDMKELRLKRQTPGNIQRYRKRLDPVQKMGQQESATISSNKNSTDDYAEDFLTYLNAFYVLQANISNLVLPVVDELITSSNNSLVRQMALSIWSDMTVSTTFAFGPFMHGMSALTSIEKQYFNITNTTINANGTVPIGDKSNATQELLAYHGALQLLYEITWKKAINACNATGQLSAMATLLDYLQPANTSIYPPGFTNVSALHNVDLRYFGLSALDTNGILTNLTSIPIS